jgi:hypothetical protein
MLFNSYLRNSVVYVPTVVKLQTGAYVDVEPVAVMSVADTVVCAARYWTQLPEKTLSFLRRPRTNGPRLFC